MWHEKSRTTTKEIRPGISPVPGVRVCHMLLRPSPTVTTFCPRAQPLVVVEISNVGHVVFVVVRIKSETGHFRAMYAHKDLEHTLGRRTWLIPQQSPVGITMNEASWFTPGNRKHRLIVVRKMLPDKTSNIRCLGPLWQWFIRYGRRRAGQLGQQDD